MPRKRSKRFALPEGPFKILAAPGIRNDIYQSVIDWAPQSCTDESQGNLLALALYDTIYLLDPFKKGATMK